MYLDLFPEAHVFSFEPYIPSFERLAKRFSEHPRVHPVNAAVGARRGVSAMFINEYADTNSLLPRPSGSRRYWAADNTAQGIENVDVVSLDAFAREQDLDHIDILKMDLQGGERRAVEGADRLLRHQQIDLVWCEIFFVPHYDGAPLFHDLTTLFAGNGYTLYNLTHLVRGANGQLRFADALYVSPAIRHKIVDQFPDEA